jgi:hypothetical protein
MRWLHGDRRPRYTRGVCPTAGGWAQGGLPSSRTDAEARAGIPRLCRPALRVIFGHVRQFEIDDVRHSVDIDAAGGNVRRDKYAGLAVAKAGERSFALRLGFVAVNGGCFDPGADQVTHDSVGAVLRSDEDEHAREDRIAQQRREQIPVPIARHEDHPLFDALYRRGRRCDDYLDRLINRNAGTPSLSMPRPRNWLPLIDALLGDLDAGDRQIAGSITSPWAARAPAPHQSDR